jgi:putative hydroxymethylpyrimidine transport system substrate-binding protein
MLFAAGLITLALCAGCGEVHARLTVGPPRPVAVAIEGPPSALYAPLYAAQADGEFRAGALAVTVTSTSNPLAALESSRVAVAIASEPQLLAARGAGDQLVAIGALLRGPLEGIVSLARRPVRSAAALSGHVVATDGTPLAGALLATALRASSVAPAKVRRIDAAAGLAGALRSRRAIATVGGPWPLEAVELAQARRSPVVLALGSAGVPAYDGEVVAVRVGEAHTGGVLLRAFLQSLIRGARDAAARPAATAAALAKLNPALSQAAERALLSKLAPLAAAASARSPFGYQYAGAWLTFAAWMHGHGLLSSTSGAGFAITNEFLPGQGEQIVTTS